MRTQNDTETVETVWEFLKGSNIKLLCDSAALLLNTATHHLKTGPLWQKCTAGPCHFYTSITGSILHRPRWPGFMGPPKPGPLSHRHTMCGCMLPREVEMYVQMKTCTRCLYKQHFHRNPKWNTPKSITCRMDKHCGAAVQLECRL